MCSIRVKRVAMCEYLETGKSAARFYQSQLYCLKCTMFLSASISMGTICTWQRAKALRWRRAVREAACRQAAGDVSASWMPPHALCPWIYGRATVGLDPPLAGGRRSPWCPVQLASWSCSALPPTSWKGKVHTDINCVCVCVCVYTHANTHSYAHSWPANQHRCPCRTTLLALMHPWERGGKCTTPQRRSLHETMKSRLHTHSNFKWIRHLYFIS